MLERVGMGVHAHRLLGGEEMLLGRTRLVPGEPQV